MLPPYRKPCRLAALAAAGAAAIAGCRTTEPAVPELVGLPGPAAPAADARPAVEQASHQEGPALQSPAGDKKGGDEAKKRAGGPSPKAGPAGVDPAPAVPAAPAVAGWNGECTIDLGAALRLGGVNNPTINLARERIREAAALELAARALLLPTANLGGNYHNHTGPLQASFGLIRYVNSSSLYYGAGARTLAAESVAFPGLRLFGHLGDAVLEPLIARQEVRVRTSDEQAVQNDILLRVSVAYLELAGAQARVALLRQSEADLAEIVRLTVAYARAGQGRAGDANRAAANADQIRRALRQAEEDEAVAAARLAGLLGLDPSARLRADGGATDPVRIIPEDQDLPVLIAEALRTRPEIAARTAAVFEARYRVREEQVRPLVPTLSAGVSAGEFGGGSTLAPPTFGRFGGRVDFDVLAFWTLQNAGVGNLARVKRSRAVVGEAVAELERVKARVGEEVAQAKAEAEAAARQVRVAGKAVEAAAEGFRLDRERIKQAEGLPLEVLDNFRLLNDARLDLLRAVVGYNIAQFRLYVAVGLTPVVPPPAAPAEPAP